MILYLSGPITTDMEHYKTKFDAAESYLMWKGHTVLNPAVHPRGLDYESYMDIDMAMIRTADGIVMLKDWKNSVGAKRELNYALCCKKTVFFGIESVPVALCDE